MEAGQYYIRVGSSSRDTHIAGAVSLDKEAVIEKVKNFGGDCGFQDNIPEKSPLAYPAEEKEKAEAQVISLCADTLAVRETEYGKEPCEIPKGAACLWEEVTKGTKTVEEFVAGLTDEQLAYLCIGAYREADSLMEVIGNASMAVAGAAGETTRRLDALGVPSLVMADGPAGLRLCPAYKIVDGEVKSISESLPNTLSLMFTREELEAMEAGKPAPSKEEQEAPVYYQYCTAIPIGTELAQSWNVDLVRECADLVGEEMERFGVHLWLAPALNIYRSPLCGRNFEYYSEDPVLAGSIAAAVTEGVQSHKGCAVTVKHYACNNQETNRYFSNSRVSERALREIYLKGFEICIKKAQPWFVMTSYNLINGEHACNRKDLQTSILRDEWGFGGVVMTDWLVTGGMGERGGKWACASAAGDVKAGNDITMPGIPSDKVDILAALESEKHPYGLSRAELQLSACRILGMIRRLTQE